MTAGRNIALNAEAMRRAGVPQDVIEVLTSEALRRRQGDRRTMNVLTTACPPNDFLVKDYELKVQYLTDYFGRMWTWFNYFVGIESALVGGKLIFGNGKLSPKVAIVGAIAEDRFLVRVCRQHVKSTSGTE